MSSIAAAWRLDGAPLQRATLDRMLERAGPSVADAVGVWVDGPVGLSHRALHATPDSLQEKLPIVGEAGDVVVSADARLDNRDELIAALGLRKRSADVAGDAEILLRAWERWGEECPARLLGDFAIALWDARRRVFFCARDPAGMKPLYYHLGPRLFAVASGTGALRALPDIPRRADELSIASYLVPGLEDRVATFYEGICRLPAGQQLTVTARGGMPRAYWQLDPTRALGPESDAAYAEQFRVLFTDAVRCRLRGASAVGAALSGGLDSSSVVCVARSLLTDAGTGPLATYTARFPAIPGCDEGTYVAAVEAPGGLAPHHLRGDTLDPLGDIDRMPEPEDAWFPAPGYYMHRALYRAARVDGRRVFLEGMGGDPVLSHGMGYVHDLARQGRWLTLGREVRQLSRAFRWPTRRILRSVAGSVASPPIRRSWRRLKRAGWLGPAPIRPDFARRIGLEERLRAAEPEPRQDVVDGARREHWQALTSPRLAVAMETLAAGAAAAGVDLRDPFLDRRVMEFCLALPASQKLRQGQTRVVARHALGTLLPPVVRDRPGKAPLDRMLGAALAAYGRERLDRLMNEAADILASYVPTSSVRRAHRRYLERGRSTDVVRVWRFATLALWLRRIAQ
jgi:asparagine synthase (glutamine-hydrolysing)